MASANVVNSNGAMKTAIGQDKLGIGYVGIGHVDKSVAALTFDKMVPSQENAASGAYTLTRLLYMNTKGAPSGLTKAFIDYIYSPEAAPSSKERLHPQPAASNLSPHYAGRPCRPAGILNMAFPFLRRSGTLPRLCGLLVILATGAVRPVGCVALPCVWSAQAA